LNNLIEQDHRAIKRIVRTMLGFKDFDCARRLIAGIETGACQAGCRVSYAAKGWVAMLLKCSSMTESRSGLSVTTSM